MLVAGCWMSDDRPRPSPAVPQCKDGVAACDASGKACADKACVACSESYKTCQQCAGREARNTVGSYGEKDAYKPYALDAAKGTCVACDASCDLAAGCTLAAGAPVCLKCAAGFYSTGAVEGGVACAKCEWGGGDAIPGEEWVREIGHAWEARADAGWRPPAALPISVASPRCAGQCLTGEQGKF